jgi:TonB-linked SusC/RagA family outer membrane protein
MEKWGMGEDYEATNTNLLWNDFDHAWLTNTQGITSSTSVGGEPWSEGALLSFFGRVNYDYHERYMASLIIRADGSSNFASGHRWGYFPSASIGWVISEEAFMESIKGNWLDYFKMRASWGQNGNCDIPNFQYLAPVAFDKTSGYSFNNVKTGQDTGGYVKSLPNEDISWETSEQTNIGIDARFLSSRLGLALDWYKKSTKDWLVEAPILASFGTGAPYVNGGDVENTGIEAALNWNDNIGKFTYGANLNFAYNKNEVSNIANSEGVIHGPLHVLSQGTTEMFRAGIGHPIGYFWGYKTAGIFQNQRDIEAWKAAGKPTLQNNPQPGDLIFVDNNNDKKIDNDDKTEIGDPNPKYTLGFSLNFGYKGFDFTLTTNGAFGYQIARSYRKYADSFWNNFTTEVFDYWHGENTSNKYPRLTWGTNPNFQEISDIYIEDGDYMKIQNITIGYDFKKLFPKMPLGQARLYVTAQNLYTFTGYKGMDPEIGTATDDEKYGWAKGIDIGFYPSPRTFLIGANLKF